MGMSALAIFAVYVNATNEQETRPVSRRVGELPGLRISSLDAEEGPNPCLWPASSGFHTFHRILMVIIVFPPRALWLE